MELMKTPKKSSKRHRLELNDSEKSPSKKKKHNQSTDIMINKCKEEPADSYSQDVIMLSQQSVVSKKKSKSNKGQCSERKLMKENSAKLCNNKSNVRLTKKKQTNVTSKPLEYFFSPKKKRHASDGEENSDFLQIECTDSDETTSKLQNIVKLEESEMNAETSNKLSNVSAAKSVKSSKTKSNVKDSENKCKVLKKTKSKTKIKVEKKEYNTLLSMMMDGTSCSDTDGEDEKNNDTCDIPVNKRNQINASESRFDRSISSSDEEADELSHNYSIGRSTNFQSFELEEEAKDVQEMISVMEEKNQLPKDVLEKLSRLHVKLDHKVPPQHMIETCAGSRGPTKEQKKIIEKLGPIKYGKFTPEEDSIIMENWKTFCKTHDWNSKDFRPFLYMRHQKIGFITAFEQRQKFVQYLANGLPWRTLYSVYWRFRNLCQPHLQSRYTKDEDALILAHMKNCSDGTSKNVRKFSELAKILNRTRASVWRRYRLMKKQKISENIEWNLRLVKKFIENLMQITLCNNIQQLKDLDIPHVVWEKVSTKMKISDVNLKNFWFFKLHMQLFCKMPIYLNDIKIKLIEYFYVKGITEWWQIEWPTVAKHFDGMTSTFLAKLFNGLFYDEKLKGMELGAIVEYGYELKKPELQKASTDTYLPRISYKNGTIKLLDTDSNNHLVVLK